MDVSIARKKSGVARALFSVLTLMAGVAQVHAASVPEDGVRFACSPKQLDGIEPQVAAYLKGLGIDGTMFVKHRAPGGQTLTYTLATPSTDTNTLTLRFRPQFGIEDETVQLPAADGKTRDVVTVSKKEIMLALMQHGRLTEFSGEGCSLEALSDQVGLRQNIVAFAEVLEWQWPDGESASWNAKYWERGTPKANAPVEAALADAFINQGQYGIGCYTASKMVYSHSVLDYYHRVKGDAARANLVKARLMADGEPLVDVEPGSMWSFEKEFDPAEMRRPGKVLKIQYGVAADNFVPGDWSYFLNTDPVTYEKTGYEGSNAIYLGRNRYDDYYNDNEHSYTFEQKIDEVYQWRNGVFSRSRDHDKIRPLTPAEFDHLTQTPAKGGLLLDLRVSPYAFGFEPLPALTPAP